MSSKTVSAENILKQAEKLQSQNKEELQKLITRTDHLLQCFYLQYSAVEDPHFWEEMVLRISCWLYLKH
jgi:hypothetical protein